MGDTASTTNQGGVGGSTSIMLGSKPLRNAAANARYLLAQLASRRLGVPADELEVIDGVVRVEGRRNEERLLRGTRQRRRPERCAESFGRGIWAECRRSGQTEGSFHVHDCRKAGAARGSSAEDSRPFQICHRRPRSGNAAWARDPAFGSGRDVCERGRKFREGHTRIRKNSCERKFRRRGRGK